MNLEEYLKEKLNVTESEAKRIIDVIHDYKKEYGHHHIKEDFHNKKDDYHQTDANETTHCNGCPRTCPITDPKCNRGKMLQEEILNKKANS